MAFFFRCGRIGFLRHPVVLCAIFDSGYCFDSTPAPDVPCRIGIFRCEYILDRGLDLLRGIDGVDSIGQA